MSFQRAVDHCDVGIKGKINFSFIPIYFLFLCELLFVRACEVTSIVSDSASLWIVAHQTSVSMGFSRQE